MGNCMALLPLASRHFWRCSRVENSRIRYMYMSMVCPSGLFSLQTDCLSILGFFKPPIGRHHHVRSSLLL
jgi:hypothetical protein